MIKKSNKKDMINKIKDKINAQNIHSLIHSHLKTASQCKPYAYLTLVLCLFPIEYHFYPRELMFFPITWLYKNICHH